MSNKTEVSISIKWYVSDVMGRAEHLGIECTVEQAISILTDLDRNHNAEIGINWDVIDYAIEQLIEEGV